MPMYEYKCAGCGAIFELIQRFSDAPLTTHEVCGGAVERLISAPALQFKGSGWYVTDYAKSGSSRPASDGGSSDKAESKTESKSETKSEPKTESKSETKSETKTPAKAEAPSVARSDSKKSNKKR